MAINDLVTYFRQNPVNHVASCANMSMVGLCTYVSVLAYRNNNMENFYLMASFAAVNLVSAVTTEVIAAKKYARNSPVSRPQTGN